MLTRAPQLVLFLSVSECEESCYFMHKITLLIKRRYKCWSKEEVIMNDTFNKWKQTLQENKEMQISDIFDLKDEDISDEILEEANGIGVVLFEALDDVEVSKQEEVETTEEDIEEEQDFQQRMAMFQNRLQQLQQDELFDFDYKDKE